jgi:Tol biopolymer transport system component
MTLRPLPMMAALLAVASLAVAEPPSEAELLLQRAIQKESVDGDLKAALKLYESILQTARNDRAVAAEALLRTGQCHEKLGHAEARAAYERVLRDYPDQAEKVQVARERLAALDASRAHGPVARRIYTGGSPHAISPDGRSVVYMDGKGNYRVEDLRTGKDTPVTDDTLGTSWRFSFASIAISPDSRQVAYPRQVGNANELRVSGLDGSGMRVLHRTPNTVGSVRASAWMPDGQKLVVLENDGFRDRRGLLDAAGGPLQYVDDGRLTCEHWGVPSPDGRFIAFDAKEEPQSQGLDLYVYDVAAGRDIPVVVGPTNDRVIGWSATGQQLLFVRSRVSSRDVWSVVIENGKARGEPRLVRSDLGNGEPLYLSRSGVLYQSLFRQVIDALVADFDLSTGHVGLPARSLNERREQAGSPRWSADGQALFYLTVNEAERTFTLVIRSEASGIERRVPLPGGTPLSYPQWLAPSPDARSVALGAFDQAPENASYGLFLVDPASGAIRRTAETSCDVSWKKGPIRLDPSWSPDGKAIYYKCRARDAEGVFLVVRRSLETGTEQPIYRSSLYPAELTLSPDGNRFAFTQHDSAAGRPPVLMSMDVGSGETRELDQVPEFVGFQALGWSADSQRILYCKKHEGGSDLWWVPAAGGTPERLAPLGQSTFTLAMDPAGKKIAWTAKSTTSELWALENLLSE